MGKHGRSSENTTLFLAAVETTDEGKPVRMKMHKVKGYRKSIMKQWSQQQIKDGSLAVTDGLGAFNGFGMVYEVIVTGGGRKSVEILAFVWVNTLLGNVKNALHGTYHAISGKHLPRYFAEFEYRFNRRFNLTSKPTRLIHACALTPPMP